MKWLVLASILLSACAPAHNEWAYYPVGSAGENHMSLSGNL